MFVTLFLALGLQAFAQNGPDGWRQRMRSEKIAYLTAEVGLTPEEAAKIVIAYEPIWAIGTGKSATKETAEDTIGFIRRTLRESFGHVAADIRILYGGSVKPENIAAYMSEEDIDGALVGGASLDPASYKALVENLVK